MKFSSCIPEKLISENTVKFMKVLDGVQDEKQYIIAEALRGNNPLLLNDPKWLILRLADYGLTNIPYELPIVILQQVLLNAGTLLRLRGSKIGLEFFCSLFSLGEVTYDDSDFYSIGTVLWPDSLTEGYITADNVNAYFHILDDNDQLVNTEPLYITVSTPYSDNDLIKSFLQETISDWLGFNPGKDVIFTFSSRDSEYFHPLLNQYFV